MVTLGVPPPFMVRLLVAASGLAVAGLAILTARASATPACGPSGTPSAHTQAGG
jgi:hypothetical protein